MDGCRACLLAAAISTGLSGLSSCSPSYSVFKADIRDNKLELPLSLFEKDTFQIVRPAHFNYEIAVQKNPDNSYKALLLKCTHQANQLTPTGRGYACSLHGSHFDKDGNVTKGPAEQKLRELQTGLAFGKVIVYL